MLARLTATALRPVQSIVGPGFLLAIGLLAFSASSRAGLFSDDEARQAILDLRTRVDTLDDTQKNKLTQLNDKLDQLRNSVLELNNQLEQLRADLAKQRGQNELLARDVAELQRKQKDLQQGVDERVSKLEPQSLTLDGKTFTVDPEEKRSYDEAIGRLRQADFEGAANGLSTCTLFMTSSYFTAPTAALLRVRSLAAFLSVPRSLFLKIFPNFAAQP